MPDETLETTAAESAEAAEPAVQAEAPVADETSSAPPWGEDFDAERAWNTIQHLRGREKELEPTAKQLERLRSGEDQDTFRELAAAYGYEIADPEVDDEPDDDGGENPLDSRIAKLEQQLEERRAQEAAQAFREHVTKLSEAAELELSERQIKWIFRDSLENGFSEEATEQAFNDLVEELSGRDKKAIEKYAKSKKAPHVAAEGQPASQVPNLDNEKERQAWMLEKLKPAG